MALDPTIIAALLGLAGVTVAVIAQHILARLHRAAEERREERHELRRLLTTRADLLTDDDRKRAVRAAFPEHAKRWKAEEYADYEPGQWR